MKQCEFCGEIKETASTIFNGMYSIECYELLIEQSEEAIKEIKKAGG